MPRHHMVNGEKVVFTPEEEAARDIEETNAVVRKVAHAAMAWERDRRTEYAPIGDQLDNITKAFKVLKAAGTDIGSDGDAQVAMSDAVKVAHPKP